MPIRRSPIFVNLEVFFVSIRKGPRNSFFLIYNERGCRDPKTYVDERNHLVKIIWILGIRLETSDFTGILPLNKVLKRP